MRFVDPGSIAVADQAEPLPALAGSDRIAAVVPLVADPVEPQSVAAVPVAEPVVAVDPVVAVGPVLQPPHTFSSVLGKSYQIFS